MNIIRKTIGLGGKPSGSTSPTGEPDDTPSTVQSGKPARSRSLSNNKSSSHRRSVNSVPNIPYSEIKNGLQHKLGKGACGTVHYADIRSAGGPCAVKILHEEASTDADTQSDFLEEIEVMSKISPHRNLVAMLAVCTEKGKLALVTEFCSNGDVRGAIKREGTLEPGQQPQSVQRPGGVKGWLFGGGKKGSVPAAPQHADLNWGWALQVMIDTAKGMENLHSQGIVHRDLKSRNLLIAGDGTVKVGDFGLATTRQAATRSRSRNTAMMNTAVGTASYMAPECLDDRPYTKSVDVYSFGIVMWEVAALQYPFRQYSNDVALARAVVDRGERPEVSKIWPREYNSLMRECWSENDTRRPSFSDIVHRLERMKSGWSKQIKQSPLGLPENIGHHPSDDETSSSSSGYSYSYSSNSDSDSDSDYDSGSDSGDSSLATETPDKRGKATKATPGTHGHTGRTRRRRRRRSSERGKPHRRHHHHHHHHDSNDNGNNKEKKKKKKKKKEKRRSRSRSHDDSSLNITNYSALESTPASVNTTRYDSTIATPEPRRVRKAKQQRRVHRNRRNDDDDDDSNDYTSSSGSGTYTNDDSDVGSPGVGTSFNSVTTVGSYDSYTTDATPVKRRGRRY